MPTPCYLVEETTEQRVSLRRFGFGPSESEPDRHPCPAREPWPSGYRSGCDASSPDLATVPLVHDEEGNRQIPVFEIDHDDPRWPQACEHCGEPFAHDEEWQINGDPIMRVTAVVPGAALEVGDVATLGDCPPGMIWEAKWLRHWQVGFDGRGFICRLPDGHDWQIDGEATNCTRKGDKTHRCWIREGEPPFLNGSKNGETCSAGAGSIQSPGYHGFLQHGVLT
jgi:hypothetical protein